MPLACQRSLDDIADSWNGLLDLVRGVVANLGQFVVGPLQLLGPGRNALIQGLIEPGQCGFRLLAFADVEGHPLKKEGTPVPVAHDLGLAVDPNGAAIASDEAVDGAKGLGRRTGAGEVLMPAFAVFGVQLPMPQDRIVEPLLLREAEQVYDLRTDI